MVLMGLLLYIIIPPRVQGIFSNKYTNEKRCDKTLIGQPLPFQTFKFTQKIEKKR